MPARLTSGNAPGRVRFITVRLAAIATIAIAGAMPASAQNPQPDGRWQAWIGCWSPAGTLIRVVGRSNNASTVCVVPSTTASSVDVLTVSDGKIIDRSHIDADGQPHAISKEGCTGTQTAKWSPSASRVYLKSEFNCKGASATTPATAKITPDQKSFDWTVAFQSFIVFRSLPAR